VSDLNASNLIAAAESSLVQALVNKVMTGLLAANPWIAAWGLSSFFSLGFSFVIAIGVKYGDWLAYFIGDAIKTTAEGAAYEEAAIANKNTPASDPNKAAREKAQRDAFDRLVGAA
jgi:hypothetical protein